MWACAHWCVSPNARYYTTVPVTNIRRGRRKGKPGVETRRKLKKQLLQVQKQVPHVKFEVVQKRKGSVLCGALCRKTKFKDSP